MIKSSEIKNFRQARGFNLIELLVSLVVVAVSLFAVAKIQITGMQGVEGAKQSTASTVGVINLIERLSIPEHRDGIRTLINKNGSIAESGSLRDFNTKYGHLKCENVPSKDEATKPTVAENAINCEIGGWIESIKNAFNIESDQDLCMNILIQDVSGDGFIYRTGFVYAIPRITIEYMWRKAKVDQTLNCTPNSSTNLLEKPNYGYDATNSDSDIGYSSMEYLLP